jgi:Protein of unknown function (DUF2946)
MTRALRLTAFHVAFAAMMLRAMMPAGWMPNQNDAGGSPLVICSVNGPVHIVVGPDGQPLKQTPHQHEACPFAAAAHLAQTTTVATVALPSQASQPAYLAAHMAVAAGAARHSSQSPRAPPISV